ncbi:DUF6122 family protein [Winogradskyella litorisediminis]|uniref:DUF6122 family protein n=1 Tax=Winogradskyella litorisediminis TaxID=1156618 RepID=A0ABW3N734_9FLAO
MTVQSLTHYGIHFIVPLIVSLLFFKKKWKIAYVIMLSTFVIDLDHLLANPLFDPNRCSINFHPLHTYYAMILYMILAVLKPTRIFGVGLIIHIIADAVDCAFILS